jgi:acylphosphatase
MGIAAWRAVVEILAKRFYVSGAVQGVGFRFFAERTAARLGIAGYVKNLFDGRVEVYAIGGQAQLDAMKSELRRGPRMSSVEQVAESDAEILREYLNGFTIERGC